MRLEFDKYQGEKGRSLDVCIYDNNKDKILNLCEIIENSMNGIKFIIDTLDKVDDKQYCIIGTLEYEHGFMDDKKSELKSIFKANK